MQVEISGLLNTPSRSPKGSETWKIRVIKSPPCLAPPQQLRHRWPFGCSPARHVAPTTTHECSPRAFCEHTLPPPQQVNTNPTFPEHLTNPNFTPLPRRHLSAATLSLLLFGSPPPQPQPEGGCADVGAGSNAGFGPPMPSAFLPSPPSPTPQIQRS
jgi:hypothetical protein